MRFAICNELFENWDFRRIVDFVADTGYEGLEVAPFTLAAHVDDIPAARRRELKAMVADRGLTLTGLHWLLVKPPGLHLTHPDAATRTGTVDYLKRLIDFCGDLGGTTMVFGSPNQRAVMPGVERDTAWKWAVDGFAACGPAAQARGVTLCLEALPTDLTNLLNTNSEVIQMVKEIDHPNIRMMVDVKSMAAEAISIPDNIRNCKGWFRYVHANDSNLQGPGMGSVDFKPILSALQEVGYDGFVSVEVFDFKPGAEYTARRSLEYLRSCLRS